MTSRQLRLLRAASVSEVSTLLAAVSHTLGGGAAPHPLLIVAVSTLLTGPAALLVGIRRSRTRVAAAVILAQAAFHLLFQALGSPTTAHAGTGGAHAHHLDPRMLDAVAPTAVIDGPMVTAHLVAALLTTLLVWHSEAVVRAVSAWFHALLLFRRPVALPEHERPARLHSLDLTPLDPRVCAAVSRRGPPAVLRG